MSTVTEKIRETAGQRFQRIIRTNPRAFEKKAYLKLEGLHVLVTSPLRLTHDVAIPLAIKKAEGTILLIAYMSESHGCWRRFGGSIGSWYNKGIDENYQTLDYRVQKLLDRVNRENEPTEISLDGIPVDLTDFEVAAFIERKHKDRVKEVELLPLEAQTQTQMKLEKIDIARQSNEPTKFLDHWKSGRDDDYKYAEHLTLVLESKDEQVLYILGLTKSGMFVKSIQKKSDEITLCGSPATCLVPDKSWIHSPIIDYEGQEYEVRAAGHSKVEINETIFGMRRARRVRIKGIHSSEESPFYRIDQRITPVYRLIEEGKLEEAQMFLDKLV
ncbi:MAG: hypothetical protein AABX38_02855 [Candidatus Micrarchaeota archaeon]